MTDVEISLESTTIRDLKNPDNILKCMEMAKRHWNNSSIVFNDGIKTLTLDSKCDFFRGMPLRILERYMNGTSHKFAGESPGGISYRIYEVPASYHRIIESILGTSCEKYYRIYIQTDDGIVRCDFGEYSKDDDDRIVPRDRERSKIAA